MIYILCCVCYMLCVVCCVLCDVSFARVVLLPGMCCTTAHTTLMIQHTPHNTPIHACCYLRVVHYALCIVCCVV